MAAAPIWSQAAATTGSENSADAVRPQCALLRPRPNQCSRSSIHACLCQAHRSAVRHRGMCSLHHITVMLPLLNTCKHGTADTSGSPVSEAEAAAMQLTTPATHTYSHTVRHPVVCRLYHMMIIIRPLTRVTRFMVCCRRLWAARQRSGGSSHVCCRVALRVAG
jgi:hypothetical protein